MPSPPRDRDEVLNAAAAVFDKKGFDRATINDIADEAGTSDGVVTFHFMDRRALALAVIEAQVQQARVDAHELKLQEIADTAHLLGYRMSQGDRIMRGAARLAVEQSMQFPPRDRTESMRAWTTHVHGLLSEAKKRGELRPGIHLGHTAELLVAGFAGVQLVAQTFTDYRDMNDRVAHYFENAFKGIATDKAYKRLELGPGRGEVVGRQQK
ncbi:TetR family transcriptional regulator [Streptomyces noursei]|uniref:TetR family transcriptional regulator n=1 Tax=Streptomyces noursei TaxID=1971 RepID=UPI003826B5EC